MPSTRPPNTMSRDVAREALYVAWANRQIASDSHELLFAQGGDADGSLSGKPDVDLQVGDYRNRGLVSLDRRLDTIEQTMISLSKGKL